MQEKLVSFQVAKLAKDKGFNWKCLSYYSGSNLYSYTTKDHNNETIGDTPIHARNAGYYSAPTQSLLQRWLREVHDIFVSVDVNFNIKIYYKDELHNEIFNFNSYEESLEAGLQESLKLIKV